LALARPDHHELLDDDLWLAWTLELDLNVPRLRRSTAFVPLADAAVLHLVLVDALALAVLDATRYAISPRAPAFSASTTSAGLHTA